MGSEDHSHILPPVSADEIPADKPVYFITDDEMILCGTYKGHNAELDAYEFLLPNQETCRVKELKLFDVRAR
jgi:hypothetical protein